MLSSILTVYRKEMKEVLRDRKTLIFMIVFPTIIMPVMMNAFVGFVSRTEETARTETLSYAVFGAEQLPELAGAFAAASGFNRVDVPSMDSIKTAVANGAIRFAVVIPDKAAQLMGEGKQVKVSLHYDNASVTSKAKERAQKVIREFSQSCRSRRLASLGLAGPSEQESLLEPVAIQESGTAEMREVLGERLGGLLPYLFIIFCFLGAMYPAIDLGAGEKERGTLETLLLAPVPRWRLVMGKFLVIFTTGVTSALLTLTSLGAWLLIKAMSITKEKAVALTAGKEILATVNLTDLLLIGLMLIPIAAMFAALLLAVSIYARSFKEASSYCGPLNFLIIVPAIIAILPGVQLTWGWAMVPVTNVSLAIKELVKGTMNYPMLIAILGSSFLTAGAMLFFCAKWFQRESVLFRE